MGWTFDFADVFPRKMRSGESEAYLGPLDVVVISKAFTAGEDAVLQWAVSQDAVILDSVWGLPDGRDVIHLRRLHHRQTLADALAEHHANLHRHLGAIRRAASYV